MPRRRRQARLRAGRGDGARDPDPLGASQRAAEGAVAALSEAASRLAPVEIAFGSATEGRCAWNRRAVTRDGGITMPSRSWAGGRKGLVWIRYLEGPMDPEVGALAGAEGLLAAHPQPRWADESHMRTTPGWVAPSSLYSVHLQRERSLALD